MSNRIKKATREIAISKFKAKCASLLDEVRKTRKPIRVTAEAKRSRMSFQLLQGKTAKAGSAPGRAVSKS